MATTGWHGLCILLAMSNQKKEEIQQQIEALNTLLIAIGRQDFSNINTNTIENSTLVTLLQLAKHTLAEHERDLKGDA
jgi:hypothetical protein